MTQKAELRKYGNRLVNDLQVYLRSMHTHDANNAIVIRARDALFVTLTEHFDDEPESTLQVQLLPEETFINSTLLPIAMQDFGRVKELTKQLATMGVGELIFDAGVTADGLSSFGAAFFDCFHYRKTMETRVFDGIQALELDYSVTGTAERDAHQVVVWLFSGLLDGLEGLVDLVDEGHTPTMVPFMRHMRLLIDLNMERGNVVRHLCFARQQDGESTRPHTLACRTFLVVQIGQQSGLDRSELMALGLASVLDAVTAGTAPSRIIPMLAPYTSLSDLAPSVMMNLHELERIRRGEPGSQKAQLLHALEILVQTVHSSEPVTLTDVRTAVDAAQSVDDEVKEYVLGWLGDSPVGSIVTSQSMGDVLLFDHGPTGNELRCREILSTGLSEVKPLDDIDASAPVRFESRIDFEYEPVVIDIDD